MPAVEFFALGFVGPVVAKFPLRTAFDAAPELARDFEVHLPAGIAGSRGSCLALKRAVAVLAGFGFERSAQRGDVVRHHEPVKADGSSNLNRPRHRSARDSCERVHPALRAPKRPQRCGMPSRKNC